MAFDFVHFVFDFVHIIVSFDFVCTCLILYTPDIEWFFKCVRKGLTIFRQFSPRIEEFLLAERVLVAAIFRIEIFGSVPLAVYFYFASNESEMQNLRMNGCVEYQRGNYRLLFIPVFGWRNVVIPFKYSTEIGGIGKSTSDGNFSNIFIRLF